MTYRVIRPFGARKIGEIVHDDAFHNVRYLLAAGMIEPVAPEPEADATTKRPQGARTKSKKPKTKE